MNKNFTRVIREFNENGAIRLSGTTIRYTKVTIDADGRKTEERHTIELDGRLEFDHSKNRR